MCKSPSLIVVMLEGRNNNGHQRPSHITSVESKEHQGLKALRREMGVKKPGAVGRTRARGEGCDTFESPCRRASGYPKGPKVLG